MLRHVVLMKCRPEISQDKIEQVFAALASLQNEIPGILAFEGGENNSPEGINRGYTHGFTMDFADEHVRETYLPHPEHEKVKILMREILVEDDDRVLVIDLPVETTESYDVYQTS